MINKKRNLLYRIKRLNAMLAKTLDTVKREDFAIFIFGPAPPKNTEEDSLQSLVWKKREAIRNSLEFDKFFVIYGEDLVNIGRDEVEKRFNPQLKEKLLADQVNLILILASSVGSAAEVAFLSQHPQICAKMVIAIYKEHENSFLNQGSIREACGHGARVVMYTYQDLESCQLKTMMYDKALETFEGFLSHRITQKWFMEWVISKS